MVASLPKNLWPLLYETATYLLNRTPTKKLNYRTPFELVTGNRFSLAHLDQIGCKAFAFVREILRREKMEERAYIGNHLGYASSNHFYIWVPIFNKVIRTIDVFLRDEINNLMNDITLVQLVNSGRQFMTIQQVKIPNEIVELDLDPYISSISAFQVESHTEELEGNNHSESNINKIFYLTPPFSVSPEPTKNLEEDIKSLTDEDLDVLSSQNYTMANSYSRAFFSNMISKQQLRINIKIHWDQLPPPPSTWEDLMKHPHKYEILNATHLELYHFM